MRTGKVAHCQQKIGLQIQPLYVANNEYWNLQIGEGGLYFVGAALLLGSCVLRLRRTKT
jgi:hypothetical protein